MMSWPSRLGALISVIVWLGISSLADEAVFQLVKTNFDFLRTFSSVSIGSISVAVAYVAAVCVSLFLSKSINVRCLVQSVTALAIWLLCLNVLSSILMYQLWNLRLAFGILIVGWFFEVTISIQLVRLIFKRCSFVDPSFLICVTVAFAWLTLVKTVMLCLTPRVSIRM